MSLLLPSLSANDGGEGGIRTHGPVTRTAVFETARFGRSRTSPIPYSHKFPTRSTTLSPWRLSCGRAAGAESTPHAPPCMLRTCGSSGQLTTCRSSPVPGKQVGVYLKREADATVAERKAAHSVTPKVACFVGLDKGLRLFSNKRPREHLLRPWAWSERS